MTRAEVEHVLRAAGAITNEHRMVVVGSQAILAAFPEAPPELTVSVEVDLYPDTAPEKAVLIDGSIGEKSLFHETFGYYAHGVGPETAVLPSGWRSRALVLENPNTGGVRALCPAPADLAISKLAAGREKDVDFVRAMLRRGMLEAASVGLLVAELPEEWQERVASGLRRCL